MERKKLTGKIEQEALRRGKKAVIAVCGPEGNPIAVHVMDGAFLVSFDVALKKAYTSVAVKMSTMELSKLAQPGGTFYGVDKMDGGKIVIFGGGVPLKSGDTIIGRSWYKRRHRRGRSQPGRICIVRITGDIVVGILYKDYDKERLFFQKREKAFLFFIRSF